MELFFYNLVYILSIIWDYLRNIIDIVLVAVIFYIIYTYLVKTKAIQLLRGFLFVAVLWLLARIFHFETLYWLITAMTSYFFIAIIILFQPELRRVISRFGQSGWLANIDPEDSLHLDELVNAVAAMAEARIGSLIVFERDNSLRSYADSGVVINAGITEELIRTIFFPNTELHDGALIIQQGKIVSAACYLPLSDSRQLRKNHGARHRAGLGIAEETDALVVLTSEETGQIAIMVNSKLFPRIKREELKNIILFFMNPKTAYEERYSIK
ncbi:MAG: diadenylate cyclase CdaA [Spirochaetes bacterium]|nr:diadenylate cyclase CdaA [Spirochaetota bacterium]MBN2771885.1 diadenylate cyclase CdaA [Spirochaetota bacterium]HRX16238.1 diadenylate cyclase CdaA [Spirochaetota bacterium]